MINMFKKKPVLQYESALKSYQNSITPARNNIPEWYKKIPKWKNNKMFDMDVGFQPTIKHCAPFLEAMTTGYMINLPYDLYVSNNNGSPFLSWNKIQFPPTWRDSVSSDSVVPAGHFPTEYIWNYCVAHTIPKGYSLLFTHPLNRHDLPFTTLSGIVDGGFVMNAHGQIPFYIKQNFEGLIPQGTPIAQLIPFRQENWHSKKVKDLVKIGETHRDASSSLISGWYKKTFWTRKKYD